MVLTNIVCFFDVQDSIKTVDSMDVNMRMVSCDLKELCYVNASYMKKICKILVFWSGISPDPHRPFGDFENPLVPPLRPPFAASRLTPASVTALGHGVLPSGIFKIPSRLRGSGWKSPHKNKNFVYILFFWAKNGYFERICEMKSPVILGDFISQNPRIKSPA